MIVTDAASDRGLKMPWRNCIAVGRAFELLREDLLEHLTFAQREIGYRYCRCHALFHDDMGVVVPHPDGSVSYRWHHVDKIYDSLLKLGLKPFVELNPMPAALASGEQTMFHYKMNVTPPKSYEAWGALVRAFAEHVIDRYGIYEVRQWYFEVWNEPNLSGFWSGTQQEYFSLYAAAARALKSVDSELRVGGPATSRASWVEETVEYCTTNDVPLDFISTHLYPQDEYEEYKDRQGSPHQAGEYFADTVRAVQEKVLASSRPDLEIHWTEWNTLSTTSSGAISWSNNVTIDNVSAAAFIARNAIALDDACDTLGYWVVSDIFEENGYRLQPFVRYYGLLTMHGIPKASFNAFRLLRKMQGAIVPTKIEGAQLPSGAGLCVTLEQDKWHVLLWNSPPLETPQPPVWRDSLRLALSPGRAYQAISARVRPGAGSPLESWEAMGKPSNLSKLQEALLRAHSEPRYDALAISSKPGQETIPISLAPYEIEYWEISPVEESSKTASSKGSKDPTVEGNLYGDMRP